MRNDLSGCVAVKTTFFWIVPSTALVVFLRCERKQLREVLSILAYLFCFLIFFLEI